MTTFWWTVAVLVLVAALAYCCYRWGRHDGKAAGLLDGWERGREEMRNTYTFRRREAFHQVLEATREPMEPGSVRNSIRYEVIVVDWGVEEGPMRWRWTVWDADRLLEAQVREVPEIGSKMPFMLGNAPTKSEAVRDAALWVMDQRAESTIYRVEERPHQRRIDVVNHRGEQGQIVKTTLFVDGQEEERLSLVITKTIDDLPKIVLGDVVQHNAIVYVDGQPFVKTDSTAMRLLAKVPLEAPRP